MDVLSFIISLVGIVALVWTVRLVLTARRLDALNPEETFPDERRESNKLFFRLLDELAQVDERYETFTRRVLYGLAVLSTMMIVALFVAQVLIRQNADTASKACADIETLKTAVRETLTELVADPIRRVEATARFGEQKCPHQPPK